MVTQHCVLMTDPVAKSFSSKQPASFTSISSGNLTSSDSIATNTSGSSSDSGEKTLNSDCTSLYIYTGGQVPRHFFPSDEEEEDWSISENATSGVVHFAHREQILETPYIATYRIMTALDVWLQEVRVHTELESPTPMISKPLTQSSSCT